MPRVIKGVLEEMETIVYEPDVSKHDELILAIHGMWATNFRWQKFGEWFSDRGYTFIAPTLKYHFPGNGKSEELGEMSVNDYVKDLKKLVAALRQKTGGQPIIILGHSMGGLIAQKLAEGELYSHITNLVLMNSAIPKGISLHADFRYNLNMARYALKMIFRKPFKPSFKIAENYVMNNIPDEKERRECYRKMVHESGRAAFEMRFGKIETDFSKISCPTLVISCGKDKIVPPEVGVDLYKKLGKHTPAWHKNFDEFGHWPQYEPNWQNAAKFIFAWLGRRSDIYV